MLATALVKKVSIIGISGTSAALFFNLAKKNTRSAI